MRKKLKTGTVSRDGSPAAITDREQAEEELKLRAQILDNATDSIILHNWEGKVIYVNEMACRYHGYPREEFIERNIYETITPEYARTVTDHRKQLKAEGRVMFETAHYRKDGSVMLLEVHLSILEQHGKKLVLAVERDITQRKQAEEGLKLRADILDSATDSIWVHKGNGSFVYANKTAYESHGYSKEEFMKKNLLELIVPKSKEKALQMRHLIKQKGYLKFESDHIRKDGSIIPLEVHVRVVNVGGRKHWLSVNRDITERKKAAEELKLRAEILDSATDSIWLHNADGNFIYANRTAYESRGYSKEEFMRKNLSELVVPEYRKNIGKILKIVKQEGHLTFESAHIRKDGSTMPTEARVRIVDVGGRKYWLSVNRDITDRKRAEEKLKAYSENLEEIVKVRTEELLVKDSAMETASSAIVLWDLEGKLTYVNSEFLRMWGFKTRDEILGSQVAGLWQPEPASQEMLETLEIAGYWLGELKGRKKDGTLFDIQLATSKVRDKEGEIICIMGSFLDISERNRMQEKLLASERLATLGQLSGSISHELRNPLGVIDSSVYYLQLKLQDADNKVKEHLDRIGSSVRSSTGIIESLLNLTRMKEAKYIECELTTITSDVTNAFKIPDTIGLVTDFSDRDILIDADVEQLRLAFKNIIKNAVDAMPDGGTLAVSVRRNADNKAEVIFSDTGSGIASENLDRIFQPLFSTKARGIGFGLSIVKMVVDKHGGTIEASSEPGKGTTIIVQLPLHTPNTTKAREE